LPALLIQTAFALGLAASCASDSAEVVTQDHSRARHLVLSATELEGIRAKDYDLHILRNSDHQIVKRISLGLAKSAPIAFPGQDGSRFWLVQRQPDSVQRELVGYSSDSGTEIVRLPLGKAPRLNRGKPGYWAAESEDGRLIHFLERKSGRWWFSTHQIDSGNQVSSIRLRGRRFEMTRLPEGRWFAQESSRVDGTDEPVTRLYLLNSITGKILFTDTFTDLHSRFARLAPDHKHLYLVTRKLTNATSKYKGKTLKLPLKGELSQLTVYRTLDGTVAAEQQLGFHLASPRSAHSGNAIFMLAQKSLLDHGHVLWRLEGDSVSTVYSNTEKCKPSTFAIDDTRNILSILCATKMLHGEYGDATAQDSSGVADTAARLRSSTLNLRAGRALYSDVGNAIFVFNKKGAHIAKVELPSMRHVATRSLVSARAKFNRLVVATAGAGIGIATGIYYVPISEWENTSMVLHTDDSDRAYVLNKKARELHLFDGPDFERAKIQRVARKPIAFLRFPKDVAPWVFYLAEKQVLVFEKESTEPVLVLDNGQYLDANEDLDRLFFTTENDLQIRSLSTLEVVASLPQLANAVQLLTLPETRPQIGLQVED